LRDDLPEAGNAESLTLLAALQATAPVGIGFVDRDYRVRHLNETLAAINGAPLSEQVGRRVPDLVPALWPQIAPVYDQVLESGRAVLNQQVNRVNPAAPEDTRVWLASYYPVRLDQEIIGVGIVVVDITERQQADELRSVVMDTMVEGLYVLDREGRLVLMNAAASKILGWNEDELSGRPIHSAIHFQHADGSAYPEEECELLRVHRDGKTIRMRDDAFTRKDGSIVSVAYSAAPLLSGTSVRGTVVVFRDISEEKAEQTRVQRELNALTWVGRIRDALDDGRLVLYCQPIVPLTGGQASEELLLRMLGRNDEIIPPGSFLPSAEKFGLIGEIDRWVITEAIRYAAGGRRIEVNLSAESVVGDPELLSLIERQLHDEGADPSHIVFEITETALMRDIDAGKAFARGLADLGCGVALDDFGTGFGSFTYLKSLPIHYLKIDIDFVHELTSNRANQHVVQAIVSLARGFGHQTIAEGVEDAKTLELLRTYGVDFAQGYHLGRPAAITPE
jgi:PAS domain S-box-containing protein